MHNRSFIAHSHPNDTFGDDPPGMERHGAQRTGAGRDDGEHGGPAAGYPVLRMIRSLAPRRVFARLAMACLVALSLGAPAQAWTVRKAMWEAQDERGFEAFVTQIAASGCRTVPDCMAWPANPLARDDPPGLVFSADCADWAYMLRAYYAWKNGLPFGYVARVVSRGSADQDVRFSSAGNRVAQRVSVAPGMAGRDIAAFFKALADPVSTGTFRIDLRAFVGPTPDFFSPAITRAAIRPGGVIYNGDGHVVIVSRVDEAGRIHYIDANPDLTVSRGVYAGQFEPGDAALGVGFHAWRPVMIVNGEARPTRDAGTPGVSFEQYEAGEGDFVSFARARLAEPTHRADPLDEARIGFEALCEQLQARVASVEAARMEGAYRRARPGRMKGVTPEERRVWFVHASFGRDRGLRRQSLRLAALLARLDAPEGELRRLVREAEAACPLSYRDSDGVAVDLAMTDALARLTTLSFDPWACPELRWGAQGDGLASCRADSAMTAWHEAERRYRGFDAAAGDENPTLGELRGMAGGTSDGAPLARWLTPGH